MDQFEEETIQERKNTIWTSDMDRCLIEALVIQYNEGMKVDKGFKAQAYVAAAKALRERFKLDINKDNVLNCMKTIKKGFRDIELMLGKSGITFNSTTKKTEATEAVWEDFFMEHPKLKNLRYKHIEMLDELAIVCGNDAATGEWCRDGPDINRKRAAKESKRQILDESNEDVECDNVEKNDDEEAANQVNKRRRKYQIENEDEPPTKPNQCATNNKYFLQTMNAMANSIGKMAEAIEKKQGTIDPNVLLDSLRQIAGIGEDDLFVVFEKLLEYEIKAKAFLTNPPDMKIKYLKKEFKISVKEPVFCNNDNDFYD